MIWCLCSKNKYVSPQSIRISTAIAVVTFNEGELSLFGIMYDFGLSPSRHVYQSICTWVHKLELPVPPRKSLILNDDEEELNLPSSSKKKLF